MRLDGITRTDWIKLKAMSDSEIYFTADAPRTSIADWAFFGKSTQAMKAQWQVPESRPLVDFAPTIILKAKDFATEITNFNARQHSMRDERAISNEHITNNEAVRNTLLTRSIRPESLAPVEDVKKVERRLSSSDK
jgi:DNA-damage-inducible protein D